MVGCSASDARQPAELAAGSSGKRSRAGSAKPLTTSRRAVHPHCALALRSPEKASARQEREGSLWSSGLLPESGGAARKGKTHMGSEKT